MEKIKNVFIIGAKGLENYGGYETFLDKLTEYHQNNENIRYHIACKANGQGYMDETKLKDAVKISDTEFMYHNAHCFKLKVPDLGSAQAIIYDLKALKYCCNYIRVNQIKEPIVYVLSSRVGPVMGCFARQIHKLGGYYWNNPDGRENLRKKYKPIVRKYWKLSERYMVKHSDLVICDSKNIEKYIKEEYKKYDPQTTYIAYGADVIKSALTDDDPKYRTWLNEHNLSDQAFYISVGRFVEENNFETMIREFMKSRTEKSFALITNTNEKLLTDLENKLHFSQDKRINFVGTVYDKELLKKIRENAYGYFHGHEVGGTNPSLLEALSSTKLNLLYDVGFNREVAEDSALYWTKEEGSLAELIDFSEKLQTAEREKMGEKARERIETYYSWDLIADSYYNIITEDRNSD